MVELYVSRRLRGLVTMSDTGQIYKLAMFGSKILECT